MALINDTMGGLLEKYASPPTMSSLSTPTAICG